MTSQLISWPKTLTEFEYSRSIHDVDYIDLPMVQSWLQVHKSTLRCIKIGKISGRFEEARGRLFDVREFPNLEELHLSRWDLSRTLDSAMEDADLLLGPKLRKFRLGYMVIHEWGNTRVSDFGEGGENWVRCLAQVAIARGHCLQEIYVDFYTLEFGDLSDGYPWDGLDRLRAEFQSPGPRVLYGRPTYTKEQWMENIKRRRERADLLEDADEDADE